MKPKTRLRLWLLWAFNYRRYREVILVVQALQFDLNRPVEPREFRGCLTCLRLNHQLTIAADIHNLVEGTCEECGSYGRVVKVMLPPRMPEIPHADWSFDGLVEGVLDG